MIPAVNVGVLVSRSGFFTLGNEPSVRLHKDGGCTVKLILTQWCRERYLFLHGIERFLTSDISRVVSFSVCPLCQQAWNPIYWMQDWAYYRGCLHIFEKKMFLSQESKSVIQVLTSLAEIVCLINTWAKLKSLCIWQGIWIVKISIPYSQLIINRIFRNT
jgi:hypothetical protein